MKKQPLCSDWEFTLIDSPDNAELLPDRWVWEKVSLPHDWSTDFPLEECNPSGYKGGFAKTGVGWYRKWLHVTKEELAGRLLLYFDGIYRRSTVYLNGRKISGRPNGNVSFFCEIENDAQEGLNLLAVRVDCSAEPSSRWYNGAGITRPVWLYRGERTSIAPHGVQIVCSGNLQNECRVSVRTEIDNLPKDEKTRLHIRILAPDGAEVSQRVLEHVPSVAETELLIANPQLWDCEEPNLYCCEITIFSGGKKDTVRERFGIRSAEFRPNEGFFLNGVNTKFKGVCMHHDAGCLGAAVPESMWRKRLMLLKEMGCNAVRTAHNPFPPVFYDICDELGMMVMDELFDGWEKNKAKHDYGEDWEKWHLKDLQDTVRRDRSHPCVILWSIGNEIPGMTADTTLHLMQEVKKLDKTRSITCGIQGTGEHSDQIRALLDVAGYNDGGGACFVYERDHKRRPNQLFVATEAPHSYHTRGFYRTQTWWRDKNQPRMEIENLTEQELFFDQDVLFSSSYDNSGVRTCARDSWSLAEKYPYLCGEFRWTGFDYLGEIFPGNYPSRLYNNGVIDTANLKKDHFYLYQSMWTEKPMVHLLPHWTHPNIPAGTEIPVWVYTNCPQAELFLNGRSLGRKEKGQQKHLQWLVPYESGTLTACAYQKDGSKAAEKSVRTAGSPAALALEISKLPSDPHRSELIFSVTDREGVVVPNADCVTAVSVSGCTLLGSDNGSPRDMSQMRSAERRAFNGLGMYLFRHEEQTGEIQIAAVLGERYFTEEAEICLFARQISLDDGTEQPLVIRYTLDGNQPDRNSTVYDAPFRISQTARVQMTVFSGNDCRLILSDVFIKGKPQPVIDLAHLNYVPDSEQPAGPFAGQITGEWQCGDFCYRFSKDGKFFRLIGKEQPQLLGYWWYDFPLDALEAQEYAGTGEIWFITGEKCCMNLKSQQATRLVIDNSSGAISTAYGSEQELWLEKIPHEQTENAESA